MSPTPVIRLSTLGSVRLGTAEGAELDSVTAQPRRVALLVYLALAQPRGFHQRETLLALFWPEYDEQRARNALSQAVHFLRRSLGADAILSRADDQLSIEPQIVRCDAIDFESLVTAGRMDEALELYKGPFLAGFHISAAAPELDHWLEGERERLARLYVRALTQVAADREAAGEHAEAVSWYRKLAAHDPLNSRAALGLIRALAAAGDRPGAIQHARIHETLLREELRAPPDSDITAFVRQLQASRGRIVTPPAVTALPPSVRSNPSITTSVPDHAIAETPRAFLRRTRSRVGAGAAILITGLLIPSLVVLQTARARHADAAIKCIAILPLENLSKDSSLDGLGDAISDLTITELGHYEGVRVVSFTSARQFKHPKEPLPEIGRRLNQCDGVMEGSIIRQGGYFRVNVQILNAPEDRHLWAETYEDDTSHFLWLENKVAEGVRREVRALAGLNAPEGPPARRVDPLVASLYREGVDEFRHRNDKSLHQAIDRFRAAVRLDSVFAPGYAGLADSYRFLAGLGFGPMSFLDSAQTMAARALAVDDLSSEAHTSKAALLTDAHDWAGAEREFKRAIKLRPGNALAHQWYAMLLVILNRPDEALQEVRTASDLDPLSQALKGAKISIQFFAGVRTPKGRPGTAKGMIDLTHQGTRAGNALGLANAKRCSEAYGESGEALKLAPDNTMMLIALAGVHSLCGKPKSADSLLRVIGRRPDAPMMGLYIAEYYAARGKPDSAFKWLDHAHLGMGSVAELRLSRRLEPLRSDPRYRQLLTRLNMP